MANIPPKSVIKIQTNNVVDTEKNLIKVSTENHKDYDYDNNEKRTFPPPLENLAATENDSESSVPTFADTRTLPDRTSNVGTRSKAAPPAPNRNPPSINGEVRPLFSSHTHVVVKDVDRRYGEMLGRGGVVDAIDHRITGARVDRVVLLNNEVSSVDRCLRNPNDGRRGSRRGRDVDRDGGVVGPSELAASTPLPLPIPL